MYMHIPSLEYTLPPETGASMKIAPMSVALAAICLAIAVSIVLESISRLPF